jgi:formate dehydrogenase major subunit
MDLQRTDCMVVMGSNFAENHPVGFRFVLRAKEQGAKIIHVDPRFTRTSALADLYAPLRAGSDIVFLGALVNYVLNSPRWNSDPFFREYVVNYTNAATLINPEFRANNRVDETGFFPGWNPETKSYDIRLWAYETEKAAAGGAPPAQANQDTTASPFTTRVGQLLGPQPRTDPTMQDPNCVLQILKDHYKRYTPELVEEVCGTPKDLFLQVAETILASSGADRTTSFAYAVAWTQHTTGVQMIRTAAILQLLLGNTGRPGGGILALRGHATIQGSTDIPTLYNILPGYLSMKTVAGGRKHDNLTDYLVTETAPTSYWVNQPKFMVSLLKAWYGEYATRDNDYGYAFLPWNSGDHSHIPMFVEMYKGNIKGFFAMGQNPAVGGQNAGMQRQALAQLDWLVVKDLFLTETATFWKNSPEVKNGTLKTADIKTEVFFFPAASSVEMDGSYTNTMRLVQWHDKAADPPGDARSDIHFTYYLGTRLKKLYEGSNRPEDLPIRAMTWDYLPVEPEGPFRQEDEPSAELIAQEINGYRIGGDGRARYVDLNGNPAAKETGTLDLVNSFNDLREDGSTACGCWIYSGICTLARGGDGRLVADDHGRPRFVNRARNRRPDEYASLGWGFAWPANRRILYNRASARPDGAPWSERKKYIWWDAGARQWTGYDIPDFPGGKAPDTPVQWAKGGLDAHAGTDPFIMKADGKGWLFAPTGLVDGPLPAHYEPYESTLQNPVYRQHANPLTKVYSAKNIAGAEANPYATDLDPLKAAVVDTAKYPYLVTTYRLTEHHLSGAMSRWLPWLAELQPEMFIEISPELAGELGIKNTDWVVVETPRGRVECKALVTRRIQPLRKGGQTMHQVGMPIHWGYEGEVRGASVNDLAALVAEPNVTIHEGKAFACNVRRRN